MTIDFWQLVLDMAVNVGGWLLLIGAFFYMMSRIDEDDND